MQSIPYSEVRANLAEALSNLDNLGEPLLISRRGQAAAVLMSIAQYEALMSRAQGPAARLAAWREAYAAELQADDEPDPFADLRDRSEGRAVDLTANDA